jgi:predicted DCC family thiol-disulfide oxidoreductase YuxK
LDARPDRPYVIGVSLVHIASPMIVLFDGSCRFCTRSAHSLRRTFGSRLVLKNFQEQGALDPYPSVTHEAAMKRMHVVLPDGRVFGGAEAFARIVAESVPVIGWVAYVYYVPGIRQLADWTYDFVARNRYRLMGKTEACDGGTCHLHV